MSPILKWIVVSLIVISVVAVDILLVSNMEWPWWMFVVNLLIVVAGIFAVIYSIKGVKWLLQRRAEKKALAQADGSAAVFTEVQTRRKQMQAAWTNVLKSLRKAKLRGPGDPVTVYPWYLVIGAPGSGKSTMIRNSRQALHFSEAVPGFSRTPLGDAGDWYLCDDAVFIDTPGYFTVPRTPADAQLWDTLLRLIKSSRKLPSLNGVVVCVPASDLMQGSVRDLGTALRQRLNEVTRVLGVRCPVYLVVTHCDRIHGMVKFFQSFPDTTFGQAFGALNAQRADAAPVATFIQSTFAQLDEELARLRMVVLGSRYAPDVESQALLFPEEFAALKTPLTQLAQPAFDAGAQHDAPFLRGLYFSSAHQEGVPLSAFMERLGFGAERQPLATANLSFFLRDFFARVLPQDRHLVAPTKMAVMLARFTQNAGLGAWAVVMVVLGVMLSVSFVRNLAVTRTAFGALPSPSKMTKNFEQDLQTLTGFQAAIAPLVEANRTSWLPSLGLRHSHRAEEQLRTIYGARFRTALLEPVELAIDAEIASLNASSPPEHTAALVDLIAKRLKLTQTVLDGTLGNEDVPQPIPPEFSVIKADYPVLATKERGRDLSVDYASYVEWQVDRRVLEQDLAADKQRIRAVLTRDGIGLRWLTEWANLQDALPQVAGRDYWGAELDAVKGVNLALGRAFTPEGSEAIKQFLADIEQANQKDEVFASRRAEYLAQYRAQYFSAWQEFLMKFHEGARSAVGREPRLQLAARLASKDSPYRKVLDTAEVALAPALELAEKPEHVPDWVHALQRFQQLNDPEYQKQLGGGKGGVVDKIVGKAGKVGKVVKFALRNQGDEQKQLEQDQKALDHLLSYYDTLKKSAESVNAPQAAFALAKEVALEVDSVVGEPKQAVTKNFWDQGKLKEYLGRGTAGELMFWQFLARPAEQIWGVMLHEAQGHLTKAWSSDVLAQGQGLTGWELVDALQGFGGKVWEFQKANLDPFLRNSPGRGYEPRALFASTMNFSPGFLSLLNRGRVGKDALSKIYAVQIGALPTDANPDALRKPHETRLVVQCSSGNQELVNHNFPIKKVIQWSPQNCGDVSVEVYVGDTVLKQNWGGYRAFISFLNEMASGRKVLQASHFPEQAGVLAGYKIRTITLAYTFSGHDGVLRLAGADPGAVPEKIFATGD